MRRFAFAFVCLTLSTTVFADRQFTDDQWREDITAFVNDLKTMHKNPFHAIPEATFQAEVDALVKQVPTLSDQQIGLEMQRLAALIGDGHTWIRPDDAWAAPRLPIAVYEFEDGVFVTHAMPGQENLVGQQVMKIGDIPAQDLLKYGEAFASRDNEWSLRDERIRPFTDTAFLERVQAASHDASPIVTLRAADGATSELELASVPFKEYKSWLEDEAQRVNPDAPLYRQHPDKTYWLEPLDGGKTLYMRFSSVQNDPHGPFLAKFSQDLIDRIEKTKPDKLIIDARHNGGGNGALLKPLIRRIAESKQINRRGHLFVLTDRVTFSAALMLTVRMEKETNALFAGEPGGGKPNSYSEFTAFTLPNSKMTGSISSLYHEEGGPGDTRDFVPMDIPVALTSADYSANRDPVLDAVLAYKD